MEGSKPSLQDRFDTHRCCVVIPTYNNAQSLAAVVDSVLEHTSRIIIADDGSTDHTPEILEKYTELEQVRLPKNKGKGYALRQAFRKARERGYRRVGLFGNSLGTLICLRCADEGVETMVLMAGVDLPLRAIREQIASAVDLIVHQSRLKDGTRRVTSITEVQGMEGDVIVMQEVFTFEQTGVVDGQIQGILRMEVRKNLFSSRALPLYLLAAIPLAVTLIFIAVTAAFAILAGYNVRRMPWISLFGAAVLAGFAAGGREVDVVD